MEAQRQELFAQWEEKLSKAQEAAEAANAAHRAEKEAATEAMAAAAGEALMLAALRMLQDCFPDSCCKSVALLNT